MRPSAWRWLAVLSAALAATPMEAATRPRYGGTLRVEMRAAVTSLNPSEPGQASSKLSSLVFEALPKLALAWQHDAGKKRLQFRLRPGIRLHDGAALTPAAVAAILQPLLNGAPANASGDTVLIQSERPLLELPPVFIRNPDGALLGTGPFRIVRWEPGRRAVFASNEEYWGGRPFLDGIEVEMGRSLREQFIDLELGKADVVELGPGEVRRAVERGRKIWSSAPAELMALLFGSSRPAAEPRLREALALSIDRAAMHNVLLQKQGAISGGLLPQWLSGYAFLFSAASDLARARKLASELAPTARSLALAYESSDPLARLIADRIAVNARDAGITLQVSAQNPRADVRLIEVRLRSLDPGQALSDLAAALGLPAIPPPEGPEALYQAERRLLEGFRVIPLFHLPEMYGVSARVRTWLTPGVTRLGDWRLDDVWLARTSP